MRDASFQITGSDEHRSDVLILGVSNPGFAGVTATDHLARHFETEEIGHVNPESFPGITPFENGRPRNHTRIYDVVDTPISLVVGELFVPVPAAAAFADSLLEWAADGSVEEIVVPYGVPIPHGPDEHGVFRVATDAYLERRPAAEAVPALNGGVLDGVVGEVMARSLNEDAPPTGTFITPVHPSGPDLEAALRLVDTLEEVYELDVDGSELRERSEQLRQYYAELADRMDAAEREGRARPENRAYM